MKTIFTYLKFFLTSYLLISTGSAFAQFTHFPTNGAPIFGNSPVANGNLDDPDKSIWVKVNGNMAGPQPHNKMHPYVTPGSQVEINFNINKAGNRYTLVSYTVNETTGKRTIYDYQSNFYNATKPVQGNSNQQLVLIPTCKFEVYFIKGTLVTDFMGTIPGITPYDPVADLNNPFTHGPNGNRILDFAYGGTGTCDTCPTVINTTDCVFPRLLEVIDLPATQEKELIFSVINNINTNTNACGNWPEIGDIIFTNIFPSQTGNNQPYQFRYNYQLGPNIPSYPLSGVTPPLPSNYQGSFVFDQRNNHNVLDFDVYQSEIIRFKVSNTEYARLSSPNNTVIPQICVELSTKHPEPHQTLPPVYCADLDFDCGQQCPTVTDGPCYKEDCCFGYQLDGVQIGLPVGSTDFRPSFTLTGICGQQVTSVSFSLPNLSAAQQALVNPFASIYTYNTNITSTLLTFQATTGNFDQAGEFDEFVYFLPGDAVTTGNGNLVTVTITTTGGTYTQTFDLLTNDPNCGITPLPVELLSFKGKSTPEGIALNWTTASEKNNDRFEVERSYNGLNFKKIAIIKGHGNSGIQLNYKYLDASAAQAIQYYRLKQVDFNGAHEYSRIIWVKNNGERINPLAIMLIPNPCNGENCNIRLQATDTSNPITIELQDLAGRTIFSKQLADDQTSFQLPKLETGSGIYILSARSGKYAAHQKIIIN